MYDSNNWNNDMLKKTYTIATEVRDNLNGLSETIRILKVNKIELMDLNILQYPMKGHNKIIVKVQADRFDLNDILNELNTCHYVLKADLVSDKEALKYELVMFKLQTRVLLLNPELQNLMNKFKVEYIDFVDDHFTVGAFGNGKHISNLLDKLIPFGIVEYSRSSVGLLKDDMVLQYCD